MQALQVSREVNDIVIELSVLLLWMLRRLEDVSFTGGRDAVQFGGETETVSNA